MKKNAHPFLTMFVCFLLSFSLHAQMGIGKIEEIEAVKSRKLIVMIEEPREEMLKKIAKRPKKGSVEDYKADLKAYNENVKLAVEKFWPYNKNDIQYMTFDQIEALHKKKSREYAVLACLSSKASSISSGYKFYEGLYWVKNIKDDFEDRKKGAFLDGMFTTMYINIIEDFGKRPVSYVPLYDVFPTKASIVYGITSMMNYFTMRINAKTKGIKMKDQREMQIDEMAEKASMLKDRTLLIREEWLDEKLTEQTIKRVYPYKFKICDRAFMDEAVMNQDPQYAYGVELPYIISTGQSNSVMYMQFVIDAGDSRAMAWVKPSTGSMALAANVTGKAGTSNFTEKTFEKIVEQVKGIKK